MYIEVEMIWKEASVAKFEARRFPGGIEEN
jgi:hypothetical protein